MLILTNCLTKSSDEGSVNVAYNLIKRIKSSSANVRVASYERSSELTDIEMKLNKLMVSPSLFRLIKKERDVLYVPFPARMLPTALRIFILSLFCSNLNVLISMHGDIDSVSRFLLKHSSARLFVLSEDAYNDFAPFMKKRVIHLKSGVDTERFCPVSSTEKARLKDKYGTDRDRKTVLHVGHLNEGRNIRELLSISPEYQVLLVTSTLTKNEQDESLKKLLLERDNIRIIDDYIPEIQELYQLSDVYFFPVVESGHCIDIPLSCLEAASCNLPVITTSYGAMRELYGKKDFYHIESFENINEIIAKAVSSEEISSRDSVLAYDWKYAVDLLSRYMNE